MGRPKQLLPFHDKNLLLHSIQVAIETGAKPVVLVLGAYADVLQGGITQHVEVMINKEWEEGMASSIRKGIEKLQSVSPLCEQVIFMVCDQPFVTASILQKLVFKKQETGKPIVASSYGNSLGIPALFDKTMFSALSELQGETGAKKLIKEHAGLVASIDFPLGNTDIDTMADYEKLPGRPG